MEQEKVYYYERKVDSLDREVHNLKMVQRFYQKVSTILVPKFYELLDQSVPKKDCEDEYSFAVLELGEIQMRATLKHLHTYQQRFTELQDRFDHLVDEVNASNTIRGTFGSDVRTTIQNLTIEKKLQAAMQ